MIDDIFWLFRLVTWYAILVLLAVAGLMFTMLVLHWVAVLIAPLTDSAVALAIKQFIQPLIDWMVNHV